MHGGGGVGASLNGEQPFLYIGYVKLDHFETGMPLNPSERIQVRQSEHASAGTSWLAELAWLRARE